MSTYTAEKLLLNISVIINKYLEIYQKLVNKQTTQSNLSYDPLRLNQLFLKVFSKMLNQPDRLLKYQMSFFKGQLETIEAIFQRYSPDNIFSSFLNPETDNRFKDKIWQEHALFAWLKEAYVNYSEWLEDIINDLPKDDFSIIELRRLHFIIKQFIDAVAPTNFASTNPEVIKAFFDSAGENFINGLDNLLQDLEHKNFQILTADKSKFRVGKNIAITKGKVIHQNELMQLIHYTPLKEEHHSIPILIVSPFINKYYILDLQPENSLVKWLLEQNYNVFLISWINPDETLAEQNFSDYMLKGPIAAIDHITQNFHITEINAAGYCIGGTLLACTIAYMKNLNDQRIKSASFFTTLLDFADAGDLSIFVDEHFIEQVEQYMRNSGGYIDGSDMSIAFNLLRSNDMIWTFYINNYLLGKEPFPFDILYWNADSSRIPMALHLFYLKNMYKDNLLKIPNAISLNGQAIDLGKIDIACFTIATKNDHIVPWHNAFCSAQLFSGEVEFILASSGHVAGIVNHPNKNKYCYWSNSSDFKQTTNPDDWLKLAQETSGSWWPAWNNWLKKHSGDLILAQEDNKNIIEEAPGSYVMLRY